MTWSYELPKDGAFTNPVHEVRFLLRDIKSTVNSLQDEEITYLMEANDPSTWDTYLLASWVAEAMADSYASGGKVSKTVGNTSITREGDVSNTEKYRALAIRLRGLSIIQGGRTLHNLGMVSTPASPRIFAIGMNDFPGSDLNVRRATSWAVR